MNAPATNHGAGSRGARSSPTAAAKATTMTGSGHHGWAGAEPVVVPELHPEQRRRRGAEVDAVAAQRDATDDGDEDDDRADEAGPAGDDAGHAAEAGTTSTAG